MGLFSQKSGIFDRLASISRADRAEFRVTGNRQASASAHNLDITSVETETLQAPKGSGWTRHTVV